MSVQRNTDRFTIVDLRNVGHKNKSWVLASTVAQVFYILDLKDEKKHLIVPGKQRVVGVDNVEDEEEYNQFDEVSFFVDTIRINIVETNISYSNVIPYVHTLSLRACLVQLLEVLQLQLLQFFGEALPNTFLENNFTREAPEGRICFLYYKGEAKKK
jgi:hypothetical protein